MRKLCIAASLLLLTVVANAQHAVGSFSITPRMGISISNYAGDDADGTDAKVGFTTGVDAEYQLNEWLGLSGGLQYSMQGCKEDEIKINSDYLNIPLLAHFYVADGLALNVGIQPGILVSSKIKVQGVSVDVDDLFETFDFSIPLGLSYEISNFVIDARYNLGVTKVIKGENWDIDEWNISSKPDIRNSVFQITLGYRFDL